MPTLRHKIVINDANILIDFCKLELLAEFFLLSYEFRVPQVVWNELNPSHQRQLAEYVDAGKLLIDDNLILSHVFDLKNQHQKLSFPDCAALILAIDYGALLLTGDKALRGLAEAFKVEFHGHIWVFRELLSAMPENKPLLYAKFTMLCNKVNPKLGIPVNARNALLNELQ